MGLNAAIAARIAASKVTTRGDTLQPGADYLLEVQNLIYKEKGTGPNQANGGNFFIAEFRILETHPTGALDFNGKPYVPNAAGTAASYVINLDKGNGSGDGDMKGFLMVLIGKQKAEEVTTDDIIMAMDDVQPFKFFKVRDTPYAKKQRADPTKSFTYHKWTAVTTEADLPAIMAAQEADKAAQAAAAKTAAAPAK